MKLAVWSGPRNLSTAMMYAFGQRADMTPLDEPFYAAWLAETGADHPMREAVIAAGETDPKRVAEAISVSDKGDTPHSYLKLMAHHMTASMPMDWAADCTHVHLIRHPARVVASYGARRETVALDDLGFRQQVAVRDNVGGVVVDTADIRADPAAMLDALCAAVGLPFDPAMLSWPAGPRPYDGAWAPHWYGSVHRSVGFAGPEGPLPALSGGHVALVEAALPYYERLRADRLTGGPTADGA